MARPVTLNRFTNVAVHEDEYKVCCGAVGKCAKDCTKHVRQPKKTGLRAPKHLPPAVQEAKKNYARAVMAACAPHICLLYTSPSPRDSDSSRMPSSA